MRKRGKMSSRSGSVERILADILTNQLRRIEGNYNGALKGSDPAHLHDLRVAIRRARFALRLFAPFADSKKCFAIRESLGILHSKTGEVRDLDISIERLKKLAMKDRLEPSVSKKLFSELYSRLKEARKFMFTLLASSRYNDTIASIRKFVQDLNEIKAQPMRDARMGRIFGKLIQEHSDRLARWGNWNVKKLSSKDLHKMRIDFKRARYLMEFFLTCRSGDKDLEKNVALFVSFQDILGKHHDALTVIKNVKEIAENTDIEDTDIDAIVQNEKKRAKKFKEEFRKKWKRFQCM